jgi:chromosome segregation ATPase
MKKNVSVFLGVVTFLTLNFDLLKAKNDSSETKQTSSSANEEMDSFSLLDESKSESAPLSQQSFSPSLEELVSLQKSINNVIENAKKEFEKTQKELANTREKLEDTEGELVNTKEKHINTQKELDQSKEKLNTAKALVVDHIKKVEAKEKEIAKHKETLLLKNREIKEHKIKLSQKEEEIKLHKKDLEAKNQEFSSEKDRHGETARQLSQKILELTEKQSAHEQQISENIKVKNELKGLQNTIVTLKKHYSQALQESNNMNRRKIEEALIILGRNLFAARQRIEEMKNNPNFPKEFELDIKRLEELTSELQDDIKLVSTDVSSELLDSSAAELTD